MKLSKMAVWGTLIAMFFVTGIASAQCTSPCWTDILNQPNFGNMASGNFFQVGNSPQPSPVWNTDLLGIGYSLSLDVAATSQYPNGYLTGQGNQTGSYPCGTVVSPVSFIESNWGSGIKGVGFEGKFIAPWGGVPLNYTPNNNLFESVFFHEDPCYGLAADGVSSDGTTSREYGFFLAGNNSSVWVYWGTHENQKGLEVQAQIQLPVNPNTEYFFEIYPVGNSSSCGFEVTVLDSGTNPVFPLTYYDVNSNNYPSGTITGADSGFCGSVTNVNGDSGYVSANISAAPQVSGGLPLSSQLNTHLDRVFVGK